MVFLPRRSRRARVAGILVLLIVPATLTGCGGATSGSAGPNSTAPKATVSSGPSDRTTSAPSPSAKARVKPEAPVPAENNPPGDIPDNLAFVSYSNRAGHYSFTHPEGWARTAAGVRVRFTDKLNGVTVESLAAPQKPTVASARSSDVPRLKSAAPAFELRDVSAVSVPAGKGVRIVFRRNSDPDPVTGKVYRDEVEEYVVFHHGMLVRMDLYGPVGADNVDAYRTMSQSLKLS
jgi:hypothetical protein